MKVVCSICLEEIHEDSCWVALRSCGHVFDKTCIDLVFQEGFASKCPVCNAVFENSRRPPFRMIRIYPSKANKDESKEHAKMMSDLNEVNQKVAPLQSKLARTENTLDSSRQEHGIALSKLENLRDLQAQVRLPANSSAFKTFSKLVSSDPNSSFVNQTLQRDYSDLKSKYQDSVNREKLAEMKVVDLTTRLRRLEAVENSQDRQRLQKQLFDAAIQQSNLSNTLTNLNLEKQCLLNEKRAGQEKYNAMLLDHKKLQDAETVWFTSNRHLQELLENSKKDLTNMKALNHDYATEMVGLKEEIKLLRETNKKYDSKKIQCAEDIKQCEAKIRRYEEEIKALLSGREDQLVENLAAALQP